MNLLILAACSPEADSPEPRHDEPTSTPAPESVLLDELPRAISLAAPYTFVTLELVGDVDGDGWTDGKAILAGEGVPWLRVLLRGPLHEPHVLPDDAWATQSGDFDFDFAEFDGDGIPDLQLIDSDTDERWLVPGPFDGVLAPSADAIALPDWPTQFADIDHDGVIDRYSEADQGDGTLWAEITWGPLSDVNGPADLVLGPVCVDEYGSTAEVMFPGDLDSDGRPELTFTGWWTADCDHFTVSLPRTGAVDLDEVPRFGPVSGTPIGDRTGDGLSEVFDGDRVWLSPITLGPEEIVATELALDRDLTWLEPAPFDLDGDALPDWVVVVRADPADDITHVLASASGADGPSEVAPHGYESPDGFPSLVPLADGGVARVLVQDRDGSGWRVVELGPAY